jgi:hypothetical protein
VVVNTLDQLLNFTGNACPLGSANEGKLEFAIVPLAYRESGLASFGFAASFVGNRVNYYVCLGSESCSIGAVSGTYSIERVGEARVMRFTNLPAEVAHMTFVEYRNQVFYGKKPLPYNDFKPVFNKAGGNAILQALGIPVIP